MYCPSNFHAPNHRAMVELIDGAPLATLVLQSDQGLQAEHLPMMLVEEGDGRRRLLAHVARANPVWRAAGAGSPALAVFQRDSHYVSPGWYPSKQRHGKVVPTWNYCVVHAHGVLRAVEDRAWLHDFLTALTARQERKTRTGRRMGVVMLSDPSGQYEALLFDEGLSKYRDLLEPGQSVILLVNADIREEGISLRVQSVQSLEAEAMRESRNLRIFLRDDRAVASIRSLLTGSSAPPRGDGSVSLVVIDGNGEMEVEMQLPARLKLSPQHANAIKSVQGVLQVEMV